MYRLGASVVNTVTLQFLDEWFVERKGITFGIQESGAGLGGILIPYVDTSSSTSITTQLTTNSVLMTWGLEKYGHRTMLIAWFFAVAILSLPSIYFLHPRVKPNHPSTSEPITLSFLATPIFAILQAGNAFQALGNFLPGIHLPSKRYLHLVLKRLAD